MVDGVYNISVVAMGQERVGKMTFKSEGTVLSGRLEAMGNSFDFNDGVCTENTFELKFKANGQKFKINGTIAEDGSLDAEGKMGFIPMVIVGERE